MRAIHVAAFPTPAEADLVDRLRAAAQPLVSLLIEHEGAAVGHILFSPVQAERTQSAACVMGLAPLAVLPTHRRAGFGAALVRAGLRACWQLGAAAVVVLGDPAYYGRFGFVPASRFGLRSEYPAPDSAFMALPRTADALSGVSGLVRYHPAFAGV